MEKNLDLFVRLYSCVCFQVLSTQIKMMFKAVDYLWSSLYSWRPWWTLLASSLWNRRNFQKMWLLSGPREGSGVPPLHSSHQSWCTVGLLNKEFCKDDLGLLWLFSNNQDLLWLFSDNQGLLWLFSDNQGLIIMVQNPTWVSLAGSSCQRTVSTD